MVAAITPASASGPAMHAVRLAKHFDLVDAGQSELREIRAASDVIDGNTVDHHAIEIRVAAADEIRRDAAAPASLHDGTARHQSQRLDDVELADGLERLGRRSR